MPFRLVYLLLGVFWQVSFGNDPPESILEVCGLFLVIAGIPLYMSISALARIFFVTVHVVPAPKSLIPTAKDGAYQQYNIWYYVGLQQTEFAVAHPLPGDSKAAEKGAKGIKSESDSDGDGVELSSVSPTVVAAGSETMNILQMGLPETSDVTPEAPADAVVTTVNRDSIPSEDGEKLVVFFTDDDIHRMFPVDARHHARRKAEAEENGAAGASTAASAAAADSLEEVVAQNERLREEISEITATLSAVQAAQEEMKAAQAEMIALVKALAKK